MAANATRAPFTAIDFQSASAYNFAVQHSTADFAASQGAPKSIGAFANVSKLLLAIAREDIISFASRSHSC